MDVLILIREIEIHFQMACCLAGSSTKYGITIGRSNNLIRIYGSDEGLSFVDGGGEVKMRKDTEMVS